MSCPYSFTLACHCYDTKNQFGYYTDSWHVAVHLHLKLTMKSVVVRDLGMNAQHGGALDELT
jgi:hypothetical protein